MQKKIIALAVAGLASTAAFAQSNVTVYGLLDGGYARYSGTYQFNNAYVVGAAAQKSRNAFDSGLASGSRLGFKGEEALGGGLKTVFTAEFGLNTDGGAAAQTGNNGTAAVGGFDPTARQIFVGLGGNFGTVTLGRQYTPFWETVAAVDPFGTTGVASAAVIHPVGAEGITRASSSIKYAGQFGPVSVSALYGMGEDTSNAAGGNPNMWSFSALFGYGAGAVGIAHIDLSDPAGLNAALVADDDKVKSTIIGGLHDFKVVKLHYGYNMLKSSGTTLARAQLKHGDWHLGVSIPMGAHTLRAAYNRSNDKSARNQDANHYGLGYQYDMSKRTNIYAMYGKVSNKNGAAYAVDNTAALTQGTVNLGAGQNAVGNYTTGLAIGLRHTF
jgi:predicted porin